MLILSVWLALSAIWQQLLTLNLDHWQSAKRSVVQLEWRVTALVNWTLVKWSTGSVFYSNIKRCFVLQAYICPLIQCVLNTSTHRFQYCMIAEDSWKSDNNWMHLWERTNCKILATHQWVSSERLNKKFSSNENFWVRILFL